MPFFFWEKKKKKKSLYVVLFLGFNIVFGHSVRFIDFYPKKVVITLSNADRRFLDIYFDLWILKRLHLSTWTLGTYVILP